jgi:copper chaperone
MVVATSEYQVTGMSCGHCEAAIRDEVGQIPGVSGVDVSSQTGRLIVTSSAPIDEQLVLDGVDEAGYTAVFVTRSVA